MREVLAGINNKIRNDPVIMDKLDGRGPFYGRLPENTKLGKEKGAITMEFESIWEPGRTENQIVTLHIWTYRKMLGEDISKDIDRLFHDYRYNWRPVEVGAKAVAFSRVDFRFDVLDPASELYHKVVRLRIRYAHDPDPD